ncbi:hypothetical protein NQ176_g1729 [Zarea fungicola]|uniref:Uncharacterized protein n=1 Tax=Zarea fungicola TaxID=93591 RepID=A0ACC1NSL2_9HYPO|nr:hypothetical protein NQ176_g1729 [Lecanicillium fungicola]
MAISQNSAFVSGSLVSVEEGILSGLQTSNGGRAFLGVPYAAPPVGDLRWRAPQAPAKWEGIREARIYGPSSIQFPPPSNSIYSGGETKFSEDCLYLNIWTGADGSHDRPVLVWFHFGAFVFGSGSNPYYDGEKLAAQGLTVVTFNYRLGRLGFLAHPELSAESQYKTSGNYGILDQIAALEWVQRNIKAFGGNSTNVTLGGASAGASSIHILRSAPAAKGLFSKVICESGPGVTPVLDGNGHVASFSSLRAAEEAGRDLLESLGAKSIDELRNVPSERILKVHLHRAQGPWKSRLWPGSSSLSIFDTANPIIDGHILPVSPLTAFKSGDAIDVPMLAGNVANEASGLPYLDSLAEYQAFVKTSFPGYEDSVLDLYPAGNDAAANVASLQLLSDQVFLWPMWTAARLQARNLISPVWYYRFLRAPPILDEENVIEAKFAGAFHCVGTEYGFGNLDKRNWNWTDDDRRLSESISSTWVQFMKFGDPNLTQDSSNHWAELRNEDDWIKIWDVNARLEKLGTEAINKILFLDQYYGMEENKRF